MFFRMVVVRGRLSDEEWAMVGGATAAVHRRLGAPPRYSEKVSLPGRPWIIARVSGVQYLPFLRYFHRAHVSVQPIFYWDGPRLRPLGSYRNADSEVVPSPP